MKKFFRILLSCLLLFGCSTSSTSFNKEKIAPIVYSSYVVINNVIGFLRPITNHDIVVENVDLLLDAATTVAKALQFLKATASNSQLFEQAYNVSVTVINSLTEIKQNPSLVSENVHYVVLQLEDMRSLLIVANEKLSLGLTLPTPKKTATFALDVQKCVEELKVLLEKTFGVKNVCC